MRIDILYSKENADHLKAALIVKEAVRNLGISAIITERDAPMSTPRVLVDGFDLINSIKKITATDKPTISYDMVARALERTAWTGM